MADVSSPWGRTYVSASMLPLENPTMGAPRPVGSVKSEREDDGATHSTARGRGTPAELGMVFGFGHWADPPRRDRYRLGVLHDHRVGMALRLASHYRRRHGSRACLLAPTLGRLFPRLTDGRPLHRRGRDDGEQSPGVGPLVDVAHRHVPRFRGGVSDRGRARGAVSALGVSAGERGYLPCPGHAYLAALARFRAVGHRSVRRHRNAAQRLV